MGLLGKLLGMATGQETSGEAPPPGLVGEVISMVGNPQSGGLGGLVGRLSQGGLGSAVASWVGTGQNQPVSPDQITHALGSAQIEQIATKLGIPVGRVSGHLAQLLPEIIDHLTPGGQVPANGVVESALGMLRGKLGL